jgi:hypothetical protein
MKIYKTVYTTSQGKGAIQISFVDKPGYTYYYVMTNDRGIAERGRSGRTWIDFFNDYKKETIESNSLDVLIVLGHSIDEEWGILNKLPDDGDASLRGEMKLMGTDVEY